MLLTQDEFEYILGLEKEFSENDNILLGPNPISWSRDIKSKTTKDMFILGFRRASIEVKKFTYNKRFRSCITLLRYDSMGAHTNPVGTDEKRFDGPHVHLYREGFEDKWAFPVSSIGVDSSDDISGVLAKIFKYCNIATHPIIVGSLF